MSAACSSGVMEAGRASPFVSLCSVALAVAGCGAAGPDKSRKFAIAEAQAKSTAGPNPVWLVSRDKDGFFKKVRDRGYEYCLSERNSGPKCTSEQDDAVLSSLMALETAAAQSGIVDKSELGRKERYVAENPVILAQVEAAFRSLYKEHGSRDARILSICFGNLTDYSPLITLPVP